MLQYLIWASLLVFIISYFAFNYKFICSGTLTRRTKWSDLTRSDWLMFGGIAQLLATLILMGIIAYTRTN